MLQPFPDKQIEMWEVDRRVNSVKSGNEPELIERVK
jgi:putative SOS response-associated peptidase YedK